LLVQVDNQCCTIWSYNKKIQVLQYTTGVASCLHGSKKNDDDDDDDDERMYFNVA